MNKKMNTILDNIITNAKLNGKLSHAYLIECESFDMFNIEILNFVKNIFCSKKEKSGVNCDNCNICSRIDNNNFTEFKIIKPDGIWIKKEQLIELQNDFSKKSLECDKRVYLILEAEKMNAHSANSLLKFIEEPEENIVAILVTNNIAKLLPTIISRCQVVRLNKKGSGCITDLIKNDNWSLAEKEAFVLSSKNFFCYIIKNNNDAIIYKNKLFCDAYSSKIDYLNFFRLAIYFYYEMLNFMCKNKTVFFSSELEELKSIIFNYKIDSVINKIDYLVDREMYIKNNLNTNLLINELIMKLGDNV